ncbi:hypothetical protein Patl1_36819 [Pistacia atlantica]|nr:hypothetical protein Patl1_36819 [Pistacia atlantica]
MLLRSFKLGFIKIHVDLLSLLLKMKLEKDSLGIDAWLLV